MLSMASGGRISCDNPAPRVSNAARALRGKHGRDQVPALDRSTHFVDQIERCRAAAQKIAAKRGAV
jgi:hypothetical protein